MPLDTVSETSSPACFVLWAVMVMGRGLELGHSAETSRTLQNHLPHALRMMGMCQEDTRASPKGPTGQVWDGLGNKINSDSHGL